MKITNKDKLRFFDKVDIRENNCCWEWKSCRSSSGYGEFYINGKNVSSHRFSYILSNGKIPSGLCVLHHCDNPGCVNPEHLFLGTQLDNMADMIKKGRKATNKIKNRKLNNSLQLMSSIMDLIITYFRNKRIIKMRAGGMTHQDIADKVGLTKARVHMIVKRHEEMLED